MKTLLIILAVLAVYFVLKTFVFGGPRLPPEVAYEAFKAGRAVIIDVREPSEWQAGVAEPAELLALSDLTGDRRQWAPFLEANKDKQLMLYCRSGSRSGHAARLLEREGFSVANIGGFSTWARRGLPTRKPRRRR